RADPNGDYPRRGENPARDSGRRAGGARGLPSRARRALLAAFVRPAESAPGGVRRAAAAPDRARRRALLRRRGRRSRGRLLGGARARRHLVPLVAVRPPRGAGSRARPAPARALVVRGLPAPADADRLDPAGVERPLRAVWPR